MLAFYVQNLAVLLLEDIGKVNLHNMGTLHYRVTLL